MKVSIEEQHPIHVSLETQIVVITDLSLTESV